MISLKKLFYKNIIQIFLYWNTSKRNKQEVEYHFLNPNFIIKISIAYGR